MNKKQQQHTLMKYNPATKALTPYPSHAGQWRKYHGHCTAWLFNPWTGERRSAECVGSDVTGLLIVPLMEPVYAEDSSRDLAPTDNAIPELDKVCEEYNNGKLTLSQLVCTIWNKPLALDNGRRDEE